MKTLEIQADYKDFIYLKQFNFSIARNMILNPERLDYPHWFEIKRETKKLGSEYFLPSLKQLTKAFEALWNYPDYKEVAVGMLTTLERCDDIFCIPDPNENYPTYIEPRPQRGKHILLIQNADEERRGSKDIIKRGERIELPDFPRRTGRVRVDIKELGIAKGTYLFFGDQYDREHGGTKNLMLGNMSINPKNRYVVATFSPWFKNERIGLRFCSTRETEHVVPIIRESTLDRFL